MKFVSSIALLAFAAVSQASSSLFARASTGKSSCKNPAVRPEWRNLTHSQQKDYLVAEHCLWNLPAETHLRNVTSLYSDLVAVHQNLTSYVHWDGPFLPWHRYFIHVHETLLAERCNYTGPLPWVPHSPLSQVRIIYLGQELKISSWWDERKDSGAFSSASIFSADTFGTLQGSGNNSSVPDDDESNYVCVTDGYFANSTLYIGFGNDNEAHCLSRNVNENSSSHSSSAHVEKCNSYSNYTTMFDCVFQYPHGAGHAGIGGVMNDVAGSPGDPMFFLHHGFIDRNWWHWQNEDLENRLYQVNGYTTQTEPSTGWEVTTLNYTLTSYHILPDAMIRNVMDTEGGYLCYNYDY